jgi:hypothetical protein
MLAILLFYFLQKETPANFTVFPRSLTHAPFVAPKASGASGYRTKHVCLPAMLLLLLIAGN